MSLSKLQSSCKPSLQRGMVYVVTPLLNVARHTSPRLDVGIHTSNTPNVGSQASCHANVALQKPCQADVGPSAPLCSTLGSWLPVCPTWALLPPICSMWAGRFPRWLMCNLQLLHTATWLPLASMAATWLPQAPPYASTTRSSPSSCCPPMDNHLASPGACESFHLLQNSS